MKITDILRAEHTVFHNIFDHIERVLPKLETAGEVKSLAELMESLLRTHAKNEEDLIFAPLEQYLEQLGQGDSFEHEHREINTGLLKVKTVKKLADARKLLLSAVAASRNHFDHEERIAFPMAERVLKAKTLTDLGSEWMKRREAALK